MSTRGRTLVAPRAARKARSMAKAHTTWTVLPHGPLERLSPRLYRVEGALEGMPLKRVMSVAVRTDGGLVVHNAMALDEEGMKKLDALGPVAFIVVPNGYHRLDAPVFKSRYPAAKVVCPPAARSKVEEVVPVDLTYDGFESDAAVTLEVLEGTKGREGVMTVSASGDVSLVFNDAIFNMPHVPGFTGFIFRHLTASTGGPKVSRIARLAVIADKRAFAAHLERLAGLPDLKRIVVSHHETIAQDAPRVLRDIAATLA